MALLFRTEGVCVGVAWKVSPAKNACDVFLTRSTGQEAVNLPHIALPAKSPQFVAPLGESVSVFSFVSRCPFVRGEVARTVLMAVAAEL